VERAELLATKTVAVLVDVTEDVIQATAANHLFRRPARDPLGRLTPVDNLAVSVADVDAVAERIEDDAGAGEEIFHTVPLSEPRVEGTAF